MSGVFGERILRRVFSCERMILSITHFCVYSHDDSMGKNREWGGLLHHIPHFTTNQFFSLARRLICFST